MTIIASCRFIFAHTKVQLIRAKYTIKDEMLNAETGVPTTEETSYSTYSWRANECPQRLLWESARGRTKQRLFMRIARFWIHNNSPDLSIRFFSLPAKRSRSKATSNPNHTILSRSNRAAHTEEETRRLRGETKGDEEGRQRGGGELNFARPRILLDVPPSLFLLLPLLCRHSRFFLIFLSFPQFSPPSPAGPFPCIIVAAYFFLADRFLRFCRVIPSLRVAEGCSLLFILLPARFSHVIFPTT